MASGEDSQLSEIVWSAEAKEQTSLNDAPTTGSDSVTVAYTSASLSSVTETQPRQEQPQAPSTPPKPTVIYKLTILGNSLTYQ